MARLVSWAEEVGEGRKDTRSVVYEKTHSVCFMKRQRQYYFLLCLDTKKQKSSDYIIC